MSINTTTAESKVHPALLEDLVLPQEVKNKLIEGLKAIHTRFWEGVDAETIRDYMVDVLAYGEKGRLPFVYQHDDTLVQSMIDLNVDATLEFFFITPNEHTRILPLDAIKIRIYEQRMAAKEAGQELA